MHLCKLKRKLQIYQKMSTTHCTVGAVRDGCFCLGPRWATSWVKADTMMARGRVWLQVGYGCPTGRSVRYHCGCHHIKTKESKNTRKKEKLLYIESLHLEHSCGRSKTSGINFSLCLQVQTYFSQRKGPGCGCYIS